MYVRVCYLDVSVRILKVDGVERSIVVLEFWSILLNLASEFKRTEVREEIVQLLDGRRSGLLE